MTCFRQLSAFSLLGHFRITEVSHVLSPFYCLSLYVFFLSYILLGIHIFLIAPGAYHPMMSVIITWRIQKPDFLAPFQQR